MRTRHARQTLEALQERFGDKLFRTVIRQSIVYAESAERAIPILDYRPERAPTICRSPARSCAASASRRCSSGSTS